ncbi:DUF4177 domain-containing protein [Alkalilacustris brevis]|uniref:DUF4177 domain-containing protein n=1 Tax=Alkalilacustris brevis TaxID=2026338 RepID=UPI000E0D7B5C|nr:DUF4177 domain-containing protein [Alkalilacustris brevis]
MQHDEYRAVPAPSRPDKVKGLKNSEDRLARSLTELMNRMAAEGWQYLRADTLPCQERRGLFGRRETKHHTLLIFRRAAGTAVQAPAGDLQAGADIAQVATPQGPAPRHAADAGAPPLSRAPATGPATEPATGPAVPDAEPQPRAPVLRAEKGPAPVAGRRLFGTTGLGNRRTGGPQDGN